MTTIPKLPLASDVASSLNRRGKKFIKCMQGVIARETIALPKVGDVADEFIRLEPKTNSSSIIKSFEKKSNLKSPLKDLHGKEPEALPFIEKIEKAAREPIPHFPKSRC